MKPLPLALALAVAAFALPTGSAGPLDNVQCMDVYSRTDVGTYSIVRRDSCAPPEVYTCPYEGAPIEQCQDALTLQASAAAAEGPSVDCYMVYTRHDVGQYSIVRRTSCSVPEVYRCPYQGAPISSCDNLLTVLRAA